MKISRLGIGSKIYGGFIILILVALAIGAAGFITLNRVIGSGKIIESAGHIKESMLEARALEKDYILSKDENRYSKLIQSLDGLAALAAGMKSTHTGDNRIAEIEEALKVYRKSAEELKQLEADDVKALREL